jgi:hypothetical protein
MLADVYGYDLGPSVTSNLFGTWLTLYEWQKTVNLALQAPAAEKSQYTKPFPGEWINVYLSTLAVT